MNATNRYDFISFFERRQHFLRLFLLFALGPDNQEIKNGNDEHEGQKTHQRR
jgi:hypothetical protein